MKADKQRIVIISTAISQPRHQRRAADFVRRGYEVHVYGFGRGFYEKNAYPEEVVLHRLGQMEAGRYFRRIWTLLQAVKKIRAAEAHQPPPTLCYAFGPDSALLAFAMKRPHSPLVYEIGDLRNVEVRGFRSQLMSTVERLVVGRAKALVLTSPGFEEFYEKLAPGSGSKIVIAENRLPVAFGNMPRPKVKAFSRPLKIAFVGFLRYPRTLLPLLDGVAQSEDFEVHIFGDGPLRQSVEERSARYPNVIYHGPFRNPSDLPAIYDGVDLNWVVYDNEDANVRLAIPNKLYESAFFGVPMVVASRTNLAARVEALGIGFKVVPSPGFVETMLSDLRIENLEKFSRAAIHVPTDRLVTSENWLDEIFSHIESSTLPKGRAEPHSI